jgi:hypothetical protein
MKNKLLYLVKVIIGISIVVWILFQVDQRKFFAYFYTLNPLLLFLILPLSVMSLYIQYLRWKYMVSSYSDNYQLSDLLPSFFAGFAFRLMIPGGHAELSKVFLLPGRKRGKVMAFAMERIFQSMIKIFLSVALLFVHFPQYLVYYVIFSILIIIFYFVLPHLRIMKGFTEKAVNYNRVFLWSLLFAAGIYFVMVIQYYILLQDAYPVSIGPVAYTVVYLWSAGVIPISISGLGIREGLAVYFFNLYGVPAAFAVATSLFLFVINAIVPALIGVYYIYKKRAHLQEIKSTISSTWSFINGLRQKKNKTES